jgi:hypothetical protein
MKGSNQVATKMEYIQKLFLDVQDFMRKQPSLDELIELLNAEPSEFRSIAFESASVGLALFDFSNGSKLKTWEKFYTDFGNIHSFHFDIGLGWAFAKTKTIPSKDWEISNPLRRRMVFDGIGYYHALYKGRKTVKNQIVGDGIEGKDKEGYDQGIGRRLWYIAKGDVEKLTQQIQNFPTSRHANLWQGVGIACGYVGGIDERNMNSLLTASANHKQQLSIGIALAAISRNASNTVTKNIERACDFFCHKKLEEVILLEQKNIIQLHPHSESLKPEK